MGYIKEIKIGSSGTANLIEPILYGTTNTAAGTQAKVVSISNFELVTGVTVAVKFTVTNTHATPQLNVNGTGAKSIKYRGGNLPSAATLTANRVYQFVYDGTNWELIGDLDTNTQTITGVKGNAESSYRTGQVNLTAANIGAIAKNTGVTAVTWDSTNKKLTRTINGTAADVVTIGTIKTALGLAKSDVGLGSVTNHAQVTSLQWDASNKKLTYKVSEGTATNLLTFAAGSNISLTAESGKITIANTYSAPVSSVAGRTGTVTLVKGDVGLDNVDNTADADKTVKYANMLTGFKNRSDTMTWGNQTGSVITYLSSSGGGGWGFRDNNPASGQMSMTIDGTIYIKEGAVNIGDAVKSFSVSGKTVTYTTLWGNTGTFTTQDTDNDTKNTAGSTNSASKLYLIGATSQAANPTTNSYQYTYTNNGLLSALKLGLNLNGTEKAHLEWNDTDQSIDFIFA